MSSFEDLECVQRILAGDREDYANFVRRYQERVLRLCLSMLGGVSESEDAAQEVFIKAYKSLSGFQGDSSFATWLYRIASNHCLDLLRKKSRHKIDSWETLLETQGESIYKLLASPSALPVSLEDAEIVQQVLSRLDPDYRAVLALREIDGLSYQEIAEVTNSSLDSVKARLRRARQELTEKLRHFLGPSNV